MIKHGPECLTASVEHPHDHRFFLRRDLHTREPKEAVVWAVWQGGFAELRTWPWNADGLSDAQAWCDLYGAIWKHDLFPVAADSLAVHAQDV